MQFKRMYRDFRKNLLTHISFMLLIALSVMIIVGFNRAMNSYIAGATQLHKDAHVEDGQFRIYGTLTKKQELSMERRLHLTIEENKSMDYELDDARTLRIICADKEINQMALVEGVPLMDEMDVVLDPKFAAANNLKIGDPITLYDNIFSIVGYGISPDYVYTLKNSGDFLNSPQTFGVAYLTQKGFKKIDEHDGKSTLYSYRSTFSDVGPLKDYLEKHTLLLDFIEKNDNSRIQVVFDDANGPKQMSLVIGILLVMMISFMISISIKNTLKSESQTIGILYAQGFNKGELLRYYILLPFIVVLIGCLIGYGGGILISKPLLLIEESQYSLPPVVLVDSWALIVIGLILPIMIALFITTFSLSKALGKPPLALLRGDHSHTKVSKVEAVFSFKRLNFSLRFRLKNWIRERGSIIALLLGVTLSMMILCTAAYTRDSCYKYTEDLQQNMPFHYLYTFIDQKDLNKYSKKGEPSTLKSIKIQVNGSKKSLSIQGVSPDSTFLNMPQMASLKENEVLISPCLLIKFDLHLGDQMILLDDLENKAYPVIIRGVASYDYGQYLYTNIKSFNRTFNIHKESYNTLMTDTALDIPEEKLSAMMDKNEMVGGIQNLLTMINVMSSILLLGAVGIFITVIYMLLKMIFDKSKINISMVKIFGYTPKEVSTLYLRGYFIILIIGFVLALPTGYLITKMLFDSIMTNMQQYIVPFIKPLSVLGAFAIMTLSYSGAYLLLKKDLERVLLTEALKNRE